MKRYLLRSLSAAGLLGAADSVHYAMHRVATASGNRRFARAQPAFAIPPAELAFDAYGHTSWPEYRTSGEAHARYLAQIVAERMGERPLAILEWGCGPGRIIRQFALTRIGRAASLVGVDVSIGAVEWCRREVPQARFAACAERPPLAFADRSFDVVYHYSVFTHLSDDSVIAWARELARVLRPGGIMIGTTHGDSYCHLLLPRELARYRAGGSVVMAGAGEGRKHFLAFHPAVWMRCLLESTFREVRHHPTPRPEVPQDVWIATR